VSTHVSKCKKKKKQRKEETISLSAVAAKTVIFMLERFYFLGAEE
jgi:hypothetical protein